MPQGVTLGNLLKGLAVEHKAFGKALFYPVTRQTSGSVAIFINHQLLQSLKELDTGLKDGDIITLLPFFDGG